jgi:hypothetical protein
MENKTRLSTLLMAGGVFGTAAIAGTAGLILYEKTIPRPKGVDEDIVAEFADPEVFAGYMEKMRPVHEWMEAQNLEEIDIRSHDGLLLHAYYLSSGRTPEKIAILHHGYTSSALDTSVTAKLFYDLGYDVLMVDMRAHGKSEGDYAGFGILDRFDTLDWVHYVNERFNNIPIVLHGVSMGASTVLMALGLPEIQNWVSAVIADCAFTSPGAVFANVMKKNYHLPVTDPIIRVASFYSKARAGYGMNDYSTLDALRENHVPVLFIHGRKDTFVPTWMSNDNYAADPGEKELLFVDNAGHGSSLFENYELYETTVKKFLEKAVTD